MHLLDTHLGLILVYISFTVPFCTWTMLGFFRRCPWDLDEAARIDGCNSWQCFGRIILPLTLPGIASTSIYAFITSWNEYMFAFILTSRPEMKTLSVGIAEMNGIPAGPLERYDGGLPDGQPAVNPAVRLPAEILCQRSDKRGGKIIM